MNNPQEETEEELLLQKQEVFLPFARGREWEGIQSRGGESTAKKGGLVEGVGGPLNLTLMLSP